MQWHQVKPAEMTNLEYQDGRQSAFYWTWSTKMAAMTSKFYYVCVIQYYTDQWLYSIDIVIDIVGLDC